MDRSMQRLNDPDQPYGGSEVGEYIIGTYGRGGYSCEELCSLCKPLGEEQDNYDFRISVTNGFADWQNKGEEEWHGPFDTITLAYRDAQESAGPCRQDRIDAGTLNPHGKPLS